VAAASSSAAPTYLDALVARIAARLGDSLVAAYLFGSAASGDYRPGVSDLDVQVVTRSSPPLASLRAIAADVSHRELPCPARKLELVVYPLSAVAAPRIPLRWALNVNTGAGFDDVVELDPASESAHWFLLDLAMGRSISRSLFGPPAESVIGPVPRGEQLDAIAMSLSWHAGAEPASANAVLNACRSWRYIETSTWGSKSAGAEWAIDAHPEHATVAVDALVARVDTSRTLSLAPVLQLVEAVGDACRRARASA
jgi:hypothetical protein